MKTVYYSTLFLSDKDHRDHVFLQSIIALYNRIYHRKGCAEWVNNDQQSNLLVVGKDTDSKVLGLIPNNIKVVLSLNSDFRHENYHIIYVDTPLKVSHLVDKLSIAENILGLFLQEPHDDVESAHSKKLKLLQWPAAEIIDKHDAYPILSALLSKRPMGFEELVFISRKTEAFCRRFVDLIVNAGFAEYITILPSDSSHAHGDGLLGDDISSKRGLLDKVRDRLGLF